MPRNISFAFTTAQFLDGSKDVTRRIGWAALGPGDVLCAVRKGMGLRKGEKVQRLGLIRVVGVRRERLGAMTDDLEYGIAETAREGFPQPHPKSWPSEFVRFFCDANGCTPETIVTRIEFAHLAPAGIKHQDEGK